MAVTLTRGSIGLLVAGAMLAGWAGASLTQSPAPTQSSRASGYPRPLGSSESIAPQAERLRRRMAETPMPARGRNPFVYGARVSTRSSRARPEQVETPPAAPFVPFVPALPVFKLSGIAANAEGAATVLTAILTDNGAMVFAKAGDKLSNGYSVVRVEETSVTLVDATGVTQTIRLP